MIEAALIGFFAGIVIGYGVSRIEFWVRSLAVMEAEKNGTTPTE